MQVVSTMGSGSIGRELDLDSLVTGLEEYLDSSLEANFHTHSTVTVRLEENGPAYTVYRTGTFQIRGATDKETLTEAAEQFRTIISSLGIECPNFHFEQKTAVYMHDYSRNINLEKMAIALGLDRIEYEPEQFPGLVYRPSEYELTILIFASGKVIVGGSKDPNEVENALNSLKKLLQV